MTTAGGGSSALAARTTASPSPSGRRRSTMTASGLQEDRSCRASATVAAAPRPRPPPSSRSIPTRRVRTNSESSTTSTPTARRVRACLTGLRMDAKWRFRAERVSARADDRVSESADTRRRGRASAHETVLDRVADDVGVGLELELAEDAVAVGADGLGAHAAAGGDFLVAPPRAEQTQHLCFAARELPARASGLEILGHVLGEGRRDVAAAGVDPAHGGHELLGRLRLVDV